MRFLGISGTNNRRYFGRRANMQIICILCTPSTVPGNKTLFSYHQTLTSANQTYQCTCQWTLLISMIFHLKTTIDMSKWKIIWLLQWWFSSGKSENHRNQRALTSKCDNHWLNFQRWFRWFSTWKPPYPPLTSWICQGYNLQLSCCEGHERSDKSAPESHFFNLPEGKHPVKWAFLYLLGEVKLIRLIKKIQYIYTYIYVYIYILAFFKVS